ncbi:MAG: twin-arginine translocation signal domain-containing protein [Kiritimatiellae bacterium]|nr:twin-arginine translocation signal domain-containing protein [Kiritimatiellia bacterium]MDD5519823.1 twin-arginine translocation signal domain-containing protein [Kiritimatiellia bacterium]
MSERISRRNFLKESAITSAGGALAASVVVNQSLAQGQDNKPAIPKTVPGSKGTLPKGKICNLEVSRMLLGGNLLTHFTHSRDLRYVYALTRHYNTQQKIMETMAVAESYGIDTLVIHTAAGAIDTIKKYRKECGGKMKCIVCPTANIEPDMKAYSEQVKQLVDDGIEAIYLWGVRSDALVKEGKIDLVAKAVDCAKELGVPSGVGAHDLNVVKECEKNKINMDFYIKTFHHHNYPSAKLNHDSMWCAAPDETIQVMAKVEKPWIAFKVMAAGAIPPKNAFSYVLENGADHVLAGMFDFEIEEDYRIIKEVITSVKRTRPWRS